MKKQIESIIIVLIIIFSAFGFVNIKLFPKVKATYVEGDIKQDTIWTLLESPFVISKNIIVYANATLTIEPGVEVRFGEELKITVNGQLYANGIDKQILFTSNKETPATSDWGAILVKGTGKATLVGCSIAYAEKGILVENAEAQVKNSEVRFCQNGINITDGLVAIQNSVIAENTKNGIIVAGNGGQVSIKNNSVMANSNGIYLSGNLTSNVEISQNKISANTDNGILIQADELSNVTITHNFVSSNNIGICVSSLSNTYLTNNSISYNKVGVQYDYGNHIANYNDLYNNEIGMDVSVGINGTVNAEYNFWGDASGPYHESLNPDGKGDKVGGNGTDLDFIFFLTKPFNIINTQPTARLLIDKTIVSPNMGMPIIFFATHSFDVDGQVDRYLLNFGDENTSSWTTTSVFIHSYSTLGTYHVNLAVMDDYGATSNLTEVTISVQNLPQLQISMSLSDSSVQEGEQIHTSVYVKEEVTQLAVEDANVTFFLIANKEVFQYSGFTNSSGYLTITIPAPNIIEKTDVRVVARASKVGYADGSDYGYVEVSPLLSVEIITNPNIIKSEETAQVIVQVRSNLQPVANAAVTLSSSEGKIHNETGTTDANGAFSTIFTAPQTTTSLNITISAIVTKDVYTSATAESIITVEPKTLNVQITANSTQTISEGRLNFTVQVKYENLSIEEADITISAESGDFTTTTGKTNTYGNVSFVFTAPLVSEKENVIITAKATKIGYANGTGQIVIVVFPKTLSINIDAPLVESEKSSVVTVNVKCKEDSTPVEGATVTISSNEGNFSAITGITDSNGNCIFTFNAPKTAAVIEVNATVTVVKSGYATGGNQTTITVIPQQVSQEGWLIMMLLLIIIPIVIVVIVLVLVKKKVIVISTSEEGG